MKSTMRTTVESRLIIIYSHTHIHWQYLAVTSTYQLTFVGRYNKTIFYRFFEIICVNPTCLFYVHECTCGILWLVPGRVTSLGTTRVTENSLNVTWEEPTDTGGQNVRIDGYRVEYRAGVSGDFTIFQQNQQETMALIERLMPRQEYTVRVTAVNVNGFGLPDEIKRTARTEGKNVVMSKGWLHKCSTVALPVPALMYTVVIITRTCLVVWASQSHSKECRAICIDILNSICSHAHTMHIRARDV